jgi:hypothetical protein
MPTLPPSPNSAALEVAGRVRQILASRNLSLAGVHRASALAFPESRAFRVPLSLYQHLHAEPPVIPDIFQMFALSTVTHYRVMDWLLVFGLPVGSILQLQLLLPAKRTFVLDDTLYGRSVLFPSWDEIEVPTADLLPLSALLRAAAPRRVSSLPGSRTGSFIYAKIGLQDAFAFPGLHPGSVVRIDTTRAQQFLPIHDGETSRVFFLVESEKGLVCCRIRRVSKDRIIQHAAEIPYAQVPLVLERECLLRGVVDLEIRQVNQTGVPQIPRELAFFQTPGSLASASRDSRLGQHLQMARRKSGLHFREASARSAMIAEKLQDPRFFISSASLSSYETSHAVPRDMHKILSLCVLYSVAMPAVFEWAGIATDPVEQEPIPEAFLLPAQQGRSRSDFEDALVEYPKGGILQDILSRVRELPYFLSHSLKELTGLPSLSLRDVFWLAAGRHSFHPYLQGALLVAVNRRVKFPPRSARGSTPLQPLYVLVQRDGAYLCGRCTLEDGQIVLHPFANGSSEPIRLRNRVDGEVVGQVVTVVRRIL